MEQTGDNRALQFLIQKIAIDVQWGNATSVETGSGHPGQTRFKNYPSLTRIGSRETQN